MALYGSLRTMSLADLLMWVQTTSGSGALTVYRDGHEWQLLFKSGAVTGYAGPELRDNLGHIVVTSGLLTEEDLRTAYQYRRKTGVSLQRAFLAQGLLTHEQLQECLEELACESIYDLFIDLPGDFVFSDNHATLDLDLEEDADTLPMTLHINQLVMEGARRQDEWEQLRKRFPSDDVRVDVNHDKLPPIESLGVRERRILASISAGQSISDICFELRAPIPSVLRTLASLEASGAVHISASDGVEPDAATRQRVDQLISQADVMRGAGQYDESIALLEVAVRLRPHDKQARAALDKVLAEQVQDLYEALPPVKVPTIVANDERLRRLRLRPEERFLLDRLAAHMDVGSLIMVSSLNERETLKALKKLMHSNIIALL